MSRDAFGCHDWGTVGSCYRHRAFRKGLAAAKASQDAQGSPYNDLLPNIRHMEAGKPSTRPPVGFLPNSYSRFLLLVSWTGLGLRHSCDFTGHWMVPTTIQYDNV